MPLTKHFVTFYSPGTFVAEETTQPIEAWSTALALDMAAGITERHNAKPYGFRFTSRTRGEHDLNSKETARSPMHYFGVKVETLAEIEARRDPGDDILIRNMRNNEWSRVVTMVNGWKAALPLRDGDIVL
jgi:hypothetical protein